MPFLGPLREAWGDGADAAALRATLAPPSTALGIPGTDDRAFWASRDARTLDAIVDRARGEVGRPWPQPLASHYARYWRDGNRTQYESEVFARQRRLTRAVVAAAATGETRLLDEAADGIWGLCEQSSWCWPAHDDAHARRGFVLPATNDPFLDLGAGEAVSQLAYADAVLGSALDRRYPGLRARIRVEADRRVFAPFERRRDWHWLGLSGDVHNWNPWIHGNVLAAALRLEDDPERRARLVALAVEGIDRYVAALPSDGATDEGQAYWWNGAGRLLEALERLEQATGGALDAAGLPRIRGTVAFPHSMHLGGHWYVNFADGPALADADQPWRTLFHWARRVGDADAERQARAERGRAGLVSPVEAGLGRLLVALRDDAWVHAGPAAHPLVRDVWLPSIQVGVARVAAGSSAGLTLAIKGGNNGEHHNHEDVGSCIVALDGRPLLIDLGKPTYTAQTFGPERYRIWVTQSQWHNLPLVRGREQGVGARFAARDVRVRTTDAGAEFHADLAGAYEVPGLRSWVREATLDRVADTVRIRDAWRFAAPPASTRLYYLTAGEVRLGAGCARIRAASQGRWARLLWNDANVDLSMESRDVEDPELRRVWGPTVRRICATPPASAAGAIDLRIEVEP